MARLFFGLRSFCATAGLLGFGVFSLTVLAGGLPVLTGWVVMLWLRWLVIVPVVCFLFAFFLLWSSVAVLRYALGIVDQAFDDLVRWFL